LLKVSIDMPKPKNHIPNHPISHHIVMALHGTYLDAYFDSENGLVRWALETLDGLKTCTAV
jgi:hypothetical protein